MHDTLVGDSTPPPSELGLLESARPTNGDPIREADKIMTGAGALVAEAGQLEPAHSRKLSLLKALQAQLNQAEAQLRATILHPRETPDDVIRAECRRLEAELGIHTDFERTLETGLFIDPEYLQVSLLVGRKKTEELFGVNAWKSWLQARLHASTLSNITIDDVLELHRLVMDHRPDALPGVLRNGGVISGDYTQLDEPLKYLLPAQKDAVLSNPYLHIDYTDEEHTAYYIGHPSIDSTDNLESLIRALPEEAREKVRQEHTNEALIRELLTFHINELSRTLDGVQLFQDAVRAAARFQSAFIAIHPFRDGNGRLSRLILQWALDQCGLHPSLINDFNDDMFMQEDDWASEIQTGIDHYINASLLDNRSKEDPRRIFFSSEALEFYHQFFRPYVSGGEPPPQAQGLHRDPYRNYVMMFGSTFRQFLEFTRFSQSQEHTLYLDKGYGELIPEKYMALYGNTRPGIQTESRQFFYDDAFLYRGGRIQEENLRDHRAALAFFTQPVATCSSYLPLHQLGVNPLTLTPIPHERIVDTMRQFNRGVLNDFVVNRSRNDDNDEEVGSSLQSEFKQAVISGIKKHGLEAFLEDAEVTIDRGAYTAWVAAAHRLLRNNSQYPEEGTIWLSPFVSTTTHAPIAERFSHYFAFPGTQGFQIKCRHPRYGSNFLPEAARSRLFKNDEWLDTAEGAYDYQDETAVPGGIDPNSIDEVDIFSPSGEMYLHISRLPDNTIRLLKLSGEIIHEELYRFIDTGSLELTSSTSRIMDADDHKIFDQRVHVDQKKPEVSAQMPSILDTSENHEYRVYEDLQFFNPFED